MQYKGKNCIYPLKHDLSFTCVYEKTRIASEKSHLNFWAWTLLISIDAFFGQYLLDKLDNNLALVATDLKYLLGGGENPVVTSIRLHISIQEVM